MTSSIVHEKHERPSRVQCRMQDVKSRSIRRVGYNDETQQLVIQFYDSLPGLRTVYSPVPREVYDGLMSTSSMGKYLEEHIRYVYDFALIDDDQLVEPGNGG